MMRGVMAWGTSKGLSLERATTKYIWQRMHTNAHINNRIWVLIMSIKASSVLRHALMTYYLPPNYLAQLQLGWHWDWVPSEGDFVGELGRFVLTVLVEYSLINMRTFLVLLKIVCKESIDLAYRFLIDAGKMVIFMSREIFFSVHLFIFQKQ